MLLIRRSNSWASRFLSKARDAGQVEPTDTMIADMLKAPVATEKLLDDIERETAVLAEDPYLFPPSYDESIAHRGIRHVKVKNHMLFTTVNEDARTITIIRILYDKRDGIQLLGGFSP